MAMMEVEEPRTDEATSSSWPFPIKCSCCPPAVQTIIPSQWMKIQDWTHLTLVVGVSSCGILVLLAARTMFKLDCLRKACVGEILSLIFLAPCALYFLRIIQQYDERLQVKQKDARNKKAELTRSYNDLLSDMDGLLTKSAESSAGLAERSFESKRRDFQRFLERAKARYSNIYSGTKSDSSQLLAQFRRFCANWLHVFEECSIDPMNAPKLVVSLEELNRCTNIPEICDVCLEKLRVTEVRFISMQRDQDAQLLRKNRNEFRRLTAGELACGSRLPNLERAASARNITADLILQGEGSMAGMHWIAFGSGHGFSVTRAASEDGYPKEVRFGFGRVVVLSMEHFFLLSACLVCVVILFIELVTEGRNLWTILSLLVAGACIVMVLLRFEELDVIQQLEREVQQLTANTQQVRNQQEKMKEFWSNAQQLTELWLYRTVPRLDLYKEMHSQLEDASNEDLLVKISGANQTLEELEHQLGALEAWRLGGAMKLDNKKQFGKTINAICTEQEFDEMLVKLEDVTKNGMKCLEGMAPNAVIK